MDNTTNLFTTEIRSKRLSHLVASDFKLPSIKNNGRLCDQLGKMYQALFCSELYKIFFERFGPNLLQRSNMQGFGG